MAAHYTLVLGTKNWSSWSLRPYMAMRATGAPFEEVVIRLRRHEAPSTRKEILKHSPAGRVPILKIAEDGHTTTVWDSLAICETLADRHPDAKLWPDDAKARAVARSYAAEMHSGFPDLRDQMTMEFARRLPAPALREATEEQIARILEAWTRALGAHDGGFLFGRFSVADCMYAPVVSRFLTYGVEMPKAAQAYCERMMALPAMQDWGRAAKAEVEAGLPEYLAG
ncbi:MAG: glutathione S-transferase family protein [Alphaproteobacteria bacterium]|nr:glutathione S-transferase family protein [Alphaproteobacteria bacterium]